MKGKIISGIACIIASATSLWAQQDSKKLEPAESSCCDCCPPRDPCAKCAQLWPTCGPDYIITPGAGPCTADGCDFFVTAEFIYWAVRQDQMGFVTRSFVDSDPKIFNRIIQPDWRMEPGFRVGIGWLTCIDGWDLYLNYTWLRPKTKRQTVLSNDVSEVNNLFVSSPTRDISNSAQWTVDFNVLDLEWGRNFYISRCLHLRPHFGLKGAWNDQDYSFLAVRLVTAGGFPPIFQTAKDNGKAKIDYWGIGPRAGLDSAWHFSRCFSVVGEVAATALWGQIQVDTKVIQTNLDTGAVSTTVNERTQWHTVKPVLEFFLGARYEDWWCCDEYYTSLDIGWETQWWGGQNHYIIPRVSAFGRWGDFGLQGLTARVRFQF